MKRYYKIWLLLAANAIQTSLSSRFNAFILVFGKLLRFGLFFFFLTIIGSKTKLIAGYSLHQIIFFFLTYQLIDTLPQMFLREVYKFRSYVVKGDFDYFLVKPFPPLFRALFGGPDILDIPIAIISLIAILWTAQQLGTLSFMHISLYILLLMNALLIAVAFHILVISMGVITTEVDNAIMLYRDITQMGRIPVDVYQEPLRGLLTFVVPVGIMMTIPAKAMMGLLSPLLTIISFALAVIVFYLSIKIWQRAIREYSSASS
ncbi:MAG TPA: ABC-2 family transporter protein [Candidatus Saccharimonadales bacterium]|nr:ABC-2 family transporter protein [Candidatus Saccharimonadales bacterium]